MAAACRCAGICPRCKTAQCAPSRRTMAQGDIDTGRGKPARPRSHRRHGAGNRRLTCGDRHSSRTRSPRWDAGRLHSRAATSALLRYAVTTFHRIKWYRSTSMLCTPPGRARRRWRPEAAVLRIRNQLLRASNRFLSTPCWPSGRRCLLPVAEADGSRVWQLRDSTPWRGESCVRTRAGTRCSAAWSLLKSPAGRLGAGFKEELFDAGGRRRRGVVDGSSGSLRSAR